MKHVDSALAIAVMAVCLTTISVAGEMKGGADTTEKWMTEQETAWAEQECSHKSILSALLAEDFTGTSPKGERYSKAQAMTKSASDTSQATDCRLLHADVRFFGSSTAVIYGSETAVETSPNAKPERYCLIWTDTWLKRGGKWQIIAAQDTLIKCPVM
jgi:hypothetical protein